VEEVVVGGCNERAVGYGGRRSGRINEGRKGGREEERERHETASKG